MDFDWVPGLPTGADCRCQQGRDFDQTVGARARWTDPRRGDLSDGQLYALKLTDLSDADQKWDTATFDAERFRRAIARACTGAGIALFSPHDLRHRLISLLHAQGVSWARIGEAVGHADLMTTARTYTHVLADEAELDYLALLAA